MGIWQTIVETMHRLGQARPAYLAAALALYIVSLFITGARWRGFLRALGGEVSVLRATLATLGGICVNNLTPSSRVGGEACRVAIVRLSGTVTWGQAALAAVWDRLSEVPPVVVLAIMAVLAVRHLVPAWRPEVLAAAAAAAALVVLIGVRALGRARGRLAGWRSRLAIDRVSGRLFLSAVAYSSLLWLQDVLRLMCAALAFGVELSPQRAATLSVLTMLGGLVPTVGGLGAVEGGLLAGLTAFGVDVPTAAAITAAERAISYGFGTCAGGAVVALQGGRSLWAVSRSRTPVDDCLVEPSGVGQRHAPGTPGGERAAGAVRRGS